MAWGLPNGSLPEDELRLDISSYNVQSFWNVEDALDNEIEKRYFRLCLTVVVEQINETTAVLYKWRDLDWMHLAHENITKGKQSLMDIAAAQELHYYDIRDLVQEYEKDWVNNDSVIDIWFTSNMKIYLDSLGLDPVDCIEVCKDIVNEDRELGITERDISQLLLPKYDDIRKVQSAHGKNKSPKRKPGVRFQAPTKAVSAVRVSTQRNPTSFLRRSERWREESRKQTNHADDADGERGDNRLNN
tara:strand:- start:152 stop:886 length:735 start_codon:yes stop_codon:yes gene_type:complete